MDSLDSLDFDAVDENAFTNHNDVSPHHLQLLADLSEAAAQGDRAAAFEAFTTLRYTDASPRILARPGNALQIAIERKDEKMAAYLLSEGVHVVAEDVRAATLSRSRSVISLLLEHGWPINAKLGCYATEDLELTRWFLSRNADPNARCGIDKTPLSIAVHKGSIPVIESLFAQGGDVHRGQLVHWAASRQKDDRTAVLKFLLQKGATINAIMYQNDEDSFIQREPFGLGTPLHAAAAAGHVDVVLLLLERGADIHATDTCGRLAFEIAQENQYYVAADLLRPSRATLALF
ncbi:hypothetical protein CBER1_10181 [Cercospora berteroae]|uniref:Uncharacterized protein n=1 Tax=Cercospora berteroae TaxID=357750 RepID=A0A2S6BYJ2_9PEZI|nr:hypothetical protein CBER1_10181 [Cercospora berteroae]